jgi:heat shock protein HslJ
MNLLILVAVLFLSALPLPVNAQSSTHASGFPVERVFNLISIDGKALSDRPRTFTIGLALNGNPYGVGFGGCHGWGANIEALDRGQIKIESIHVTQAQPQGACTPEQQRAEDDFLTVLKQDAVHWRMEEQTLVLESNARTIRMAAGPFADRSVPPAIRQALLERGAASPTQSSVKAIFEKRGLIGAFAWDCSKPPNSNSNWYFVNRVIDADHVQRDYMTDQTTRAWYVIIDRAEERGANEIFGSGTRDGQPIESIWRIEPNRMLQWEATQAGKKIIAAGKWVATGKDMPWLNRCGN